MSTATETRSFCDVCQNMVFVAVDAHGTNLAACENCLQEYEVYKLQFPEATLNDFAKRKRVFS